MNFSACTTRIAFSLATTLISLSAAAQVSVSNPWVRATVPAQKATGAFMDLTATQDARLVAVKSPGAGTVEVHEMSTDGGVMKMRAMPDGLELPAGRSVELKPGGYHIMQAPDPRCHRSGQSAVDQRRTEGPQQSRCALNTRSALVKSARSARSTDIFR